MHSSIDDINDLPDIYAKAIEFIGNDRFHVNTSDQINGHDVYIGSWDGPDLPFMGISEADLDRLLEAKVKGTLPLEDPIRLIDNEFNRICHFCKQTEYYFDGINLVAKTPCPFPEGFTPFTIDLAVPSGKMMFADWIPGFGPGRDAEFNVNYHFGVAETIRAHEKDKAAHFFTGNSCPGVYRDGDRFIVASVSEEDEVEYEGYEDCGGLVTDLWWATFVDADEFKRRGSEEGRYIEEMEVEPGTYRFDYKLLKRPVINDYGETAVVYATFKRLCN